jgi:biotin operon repressor
MLETSARLLRLLSLLQTHRDWSGAELADRLGVTQRTVRRDVDRVRQLGYPVDAQPGSGGGYRLGPGAVLPPLLFEDDEAVAVAVGLRSATLAGVAGIEETAMRALAKLEQVLPSRLRHRVQTLQVAIVPIPGSGPNVDVDVLLAVASAIRDHQQLRAGYIARDDTESGGYSNRTRSCTPDATGTWSPGTSSAWTGGRSGWIGSVHTFSSAPGSRLASHPSPTSPDTPLKGSPPTPTATGAASL